MSDAERDLMGITGRIVVLHEEACMHLDAGNESLAASCYAQSETLVKMALKICKENRIKTLTPQNTNKR